MINANELRIGNWVDINGEIREWTLNDFYDLIENTGKIEEFTNPIPLTHEILEKCGFEGTNCKEISNYEWLVIHIETGEANIDNLQKNITAQIRIPCKFLHQLQNLIFALTGTELTINFS